MLVQRAPRVAQRRVDEGSRSRRSTRYARATRCPVRTGEVVPVDGTVVIGEAVLDTSTLSGEPRASRIGRAVCGPGSEEEAAEAVDRRGSDDDDQRGARDLDRRADHDDEQVLE